MLSILIRLGHTKYIDVSNSGQLPDIISRTIFFSACYFFHSFCGMVVCQAIHAILHVVYMFIGFFEPKKNAKCGIFRPVIRSTFNNMCDYSHIVNVEHSLHEFIICFSLSQPRKRERDKEEARAPWTEREKAKDKDANDEKRRNSSRNNTNGRLRMNWDEELQKPDHKLSLNKTLQYQRYLVESTCVENLFAVLLCLEWNLFCTKRNHIFHCVRMNVSEHMSIHRFFIISLLLFSGFRQNPFIDFLQTILEWNIYLERGKWSDYYEIKWNSRSYVW